MAANNLKKLPLLVRQSIRDVWDSEDAGAAKHVDAVSRSLGIRVKVEPAWELLWNDVETVFVDQTAFAPAVTRCVVALCEAMTAALNEPNSEELFDGILDDLTGKQSLAIIPKINPIADERLPRAIWRKREAQMDLLVPRTREVVASPRLVQGLSKDVHVILRGGNPVVTPQEPQRRQQVTEMHTKQAPVADEQWNVVGESLPSGLPSLNEIERPEQLLTKPPYHLTVDCSSQQITVQCGHLDSLLLLEEYLKRWTRQVPAYGTDGETVKMHLYEAAFGNASNYDTLVLRAHRLDYLSPSLILTFVQRVLNYTLDKDTSRGSTWSFIRTSPIG